MEIATFFTLPKSHLFTTNRDVSENNHKNAPVCGDSKSSFIRSHLSSRGPVPGACHAEPNVLHGVIKTAASRAPPAILAILLLHPVCRGRTQAPALRQRAPLISETPAARLKTDRPGVDGEGEGPAEKESSQFLGAAVSQRGCDRSLRVVVSQRQADTRRLLNRIRYAVRPSQK